jgi:antitoxin component YwqK of YwqJK toxin-antitoxin module
MKITKDTNHKWYSTGNFTVESNRKNRKTGLYTEYHLMGKLIPRDFAAFLLKKYRIK